MKNKQKTLSLFANWVSVIGIVLGCFGFGLSVVFMAVDMLYGFTNAYVGMLVYMAYPGIMLAGIAIACFGAFLTLRRRRRGERAKTFPVVDLNDRKTFVRFLVSGFLLFVFLMLSCVGLYRAYHYTESVAFCGEVCHEVMEPEYTAYKNSPHAKVTCAGCHIGHGASWFVKSKITGSYQIYSVLFNKFSRPIETPVHDLRPPKETCGNCHWPKKFFGAVQKSWTYYLPDETNTPWTIKMMVKVGGGDPTHGAVEGIHWHMNEGNSIEYVSVDDKRLEIPWVRATDRDGNETVYYNEEEGKLTEESLDAMAMRKMDCIDCHNRPTHHFNSPNKAVDLALKLGRIDSSILNIKSRAVDLLIGDYEDKDQAFRAIEEGLRKDYGQRGDVDTVVRELQTIYGNNFFPKMKSSWRKYPDHIGHKITPGCFRCHDGKHVSDSGKKISRDCNTCHVITAQGGGVEMKAVSADGLEFKHPEDIDGEWKTENCDTCHEGTPM